MSKVIYIGELALHVSLAADGSAATRVGDRLVAAAIMDARMGVDTKFLGEASADAVGDHMVQVLETSGIDTKSVDRFTEGASAVRVTSAGAGDDDPRAVMHSAYPPAPVNPVWPRMEQGDVTVYGSFMALDKRNHERILELVRYCTSRKGRAVYVPYFDTTRVKRITLIMPEVWACLGEASVVIATVADLQALFPGEQPEAVYRDHIQFHCPRCLLLDPAGARMHFWQDDRRWSRQCRAGAGGAFHWVAGAIAGAVRAIAEGMDDPEDIMERADETAHSHLADKI